MIASLQDQIEGLNEFKNARPFSSKVDRERTDTINKSVESQIAARNSELQTLQSQLASETDASKQKSIQDEIKKIEARIQTLNKYLNGESQSLRYKIGGVDIKISRADGLKIDTLLRELQRYEGVDIYRLGASGDHVPNTDDERPAEIVKEIDEILERATPVTSNTTISKLSDLLTRQMTGNVPVNFRKIVGWFM